MKTEQTSSVTDVIQNTITGKNAVLEAVSSDAEIDVIYVLKGANTGKIIPLAKNKGIVIKDVNEEKLNNIAPGEKHGGVVAVLACTSYSSVDDILAYAKEKGEAPFVIIADGIEDPHNLGAVIRTAEAAGVHGLIIPKRHSATLNSTVYKTSAGAASWLKVARVSNLTDTVKQLKKCGLWVYGAEADGVSYTSADYKGPIALVIGSEGSGISRLLKENCDHIVALPMKGKINSLNASVAAGILIYEIVKHR